mmetsp:Transcript_16515/g.37968  ORF Transcript_16515/g.37968 Transcript_16515/m.37968 type:complete len:95 (+) Transcript_16515:1756-2040(+)
MGRRRMGCRRQGRCRREIVRDHDRPGPMGTARVALPKRLEGGLSDGGRKGPAAQAVVAASRFRINEEVVTSYRRSAAQRNAMHYTENHPTVGIL